MRSSDRVFGRAYFCGLGGVAGFCAGAGCVFTGCDFNPCSTEVGPPRLVAVDRQCDGSDHECDSRPRGGFGEGAGRAARTECSLAALSSECRGNIAALAALQQNDNDNEETDQDMNGDD